MARATARQDSGEQSSCVPSTRLLQWTVADCVAVPLGYVDFPSGGNCSTITCGNPIARSANRTELSSTAPSSGCTGSGQCTSGFDGLDCNICQNSNACSAAIATFGAANTSSAPSDATSGLLGTSEMLCSKSPYTYTSSFIECNVINPTLQGVFPGTTIL